MEYDKDMNRFEKGEIVLYHGPLWDEIVEITRIRPIGEYGSTNLNYKYSLKTVRDGESVLNIREIKLESLDDMAQVLYGK